MFRYAQRALGRFDHPLLVALYLSAVAAGLLGLVLELLGTRPLAAAFLAVYAIVFATIASVGYGIALAAKFASRALDRQAPHT